MWRLMLVLAAGAGLMAAPSFSAAQQQAVSGYDAQGRLRCVRYQTTTGGQTTVRTTTYSYDAAGNRTSVVTNGDSCVSTVGSAPVPPADPNATITVTNPTIQLVSQGGSVRSVATLGAASDGQTLSVVAATTGGSLGACGSVSHTAAQTSYTAPAVSPAGTFVSCWVDYTLSHPAGQQKLGRITYVIEGVGGDPGDPPDDCVPNPMTGMCELG